MNTSTTLNRRAALRLALASTFAGGFANASADHAPQQRARRFGPYATMRRANEVANEFRRRGCAAVAFHNGDGYYVDVRC